MSTMLQLKKLFFKFTQAYDTHIVENVLWNSTVEGSDKNS